MRPVRVLVALILLLVLPLQLTFAAGAEYCEIGKSHSSHFGHHIHAAQDTQGKTDGDPDGGKSSGKHCSFCHLGCSLVQATAFEVLAVGVHKIYLAEDTPLLLGIPARVPDLPPRSSLV